MFYNNRWKELTKWMELQEEINRDLQKEIVQMEKIIMELMKKIKKEAGRPKKKK